MSDSNSFIEEMLEHNTRFVKEELYMPYAATKIPEKKTAVLSCMDTRLTELLPAALGVKNGDVVLIKNAGAVISHPFGSIMRSLLVAVYELGVENILVIAHYGCGVHRLAPESLIQKMLERGITTETIDMLKYCGVDIDRWLRGFDDVSQSVQNAVDSILNHPFMPSDITVRGFVLDPETGRMDAV